MKKIIHILVLSLFMWFAYVQINDPDPWGWVLIYLGISVLALLSLLRRPVPPLALAGAIISVAGFLYLTPQFISWVQDGMPTIVGQMKAEEQHIEYVREFLGYIIAAVAYVAYYVEHKKIQT